jgi:hypothetical protein
MPQPTLDERFAGGPPERNEKLKRTWLTAEEQRFILWALREKWPLRRIGDALGVSEATIRRFRLRFWAQPSLILDLGLYEMVGSASDNEFRCLVCNDRVLIRQNMERHVLSHFLDTPKVDVVAPAIKVPKPRKTTDRKRMTK